ncbi:MAG: tetratricopeptide repeat protein [Bacteroidota bacterium]|nr:tetratricopeptide repeat protein [Bacteroidota bacterium]
MKKGISIITFLLLSITAFAQENNKELVTMYENDQASRMNGPIDWAVLSREDSIRRASVDRMIKEGKVKTAQDFYHAAMIYQHGSDTIASGKAVQYMKKAVEMDPSTNKWLLAAAIDRDLMRKGEPQIYGTQFLKNGMNESYIQYEIDSTQVSDAQRQEYGVPTLAQQKIQLEKMNQKKLAAMLSDKKVEDIAVFIQDHYEDENSEYDLSEMGINSFGYQLMAMNRNEDALIILKLNTELYPKGANTWDSLGEIYQNLGKTQQSIRAYKKSLELNPENDHARKMIQEQQNSED